MLYRNYDGAPCFGSEFRLSSTNQPAAESQSPDCCSNFRLTPPSPFAPKTEGIFKHLFGREMPGAHTALGDIQGLERILSAPGIAERWDGRMSLYSVPHAHWSFIFACACAKRHVIIPFMLSRKKGRNIKRTVSHTLPVEIRWELVASIRRHFYTYSGSARSTLVFG